MLRARNESRATSLASRLDVADDIMGKFRGLMGRSSLDADAGLWLPDSNGIHMMFMRFAIDAVFLGKPEDGAARKVVAVRRALKPWTGVVWYVRGAHGVLELPVGTIDRTATAVGDTIRLDPV